MIYEIDFATFGLANKLNSTGWLGNFDRQWILPALVHDGEPATLESMQGFPALLFDVSFSEDSAVGLWGCEQSTHQLFQHKFASGARRIRLA